MSSTASDSSYSALLPMGLTCGADLNFKVTIDTNEGTWNETFTQVNGEIIPGGDAVAWSEDFGHFTARFPGALFGLGAGVEQPALHHPDYDFPDALLQHGVRFFLAAAERLLRE